jgi:CheY-like chemotaxis protein
MENNLRLLIVDDDPDDREFFMEAVKEVDETIECVTASNGIQPLQWLRHTGHPVPDLIFSDISMPLLNGRNWPK